MDAVPSLPFAGITITSGTPNPNAKDGTGERSADALTVSSPMPVLAPVADAGEADAPQRLPVARHVTAILDEYRQVLKHRSRLRLRFLDAQRTLAGLPSSHARHSQTLADLDLLRVNLEVDSSLLALLSLELRYASAF